MKRIGCSSKGHRLNSWHPYVGLQQSVTPVLGNPRAPGVYVVYRHIWQNTKRIIKHLELKTSGCKVIPLGFDCISLMSREYSNVFVDSFFGCCSETRFLCVPLAILELTVQTRLASSSDLPASASGVCYHLLACWSLLYSICSSPLSISVIRDYFLFVKQCLT